MANDYKFAPMPDVPSFAPRLYGITLLLLAICGVGFWLVTRFIAIDLARDLQTWQEKLNLIAESRSADVTKFVTEQFKDLRTLADNPSLQLYLTELRTEKTSDGDEPAQKTYLRNLLLFTAQRSGYMQTNLLSAIPANVQDEGKNGLIVLDNDNQIIVSTPSAETTRNIILEHTKTSVAGQEALIDIARSTDGDPYIGFTMPIFSVQTEHVAESQIGKVIGVKIVDGNLFGLLKHPGTTERTLETMLLRQRDGKLEYISPLQDGSGALSKEVGVGTRITENALMQTIGNFSTNLSDYRNKPVLATSRAIAGTPWVLVVKIDKAEALAAGNQRRANMNVLFGMIILTIALIIVAIWRYAHSQRAMFMSQHFRKMAARARAQEQLLRLVADNQPESIYIVDATFNYHFANRKAAEENNMAHGSLEGKNINDVRGSARAENVVTNCKNVLKGNEIIFDIQHLQGENHQLVLRSAYVPLLHVPVAGLPDPTPGVLVIEQDISEVVHEREERLLIQYQLVQTLVKLVDRRDPFAANHSLLVSQIAYEIATDMELDKTTVETARTAGSLMNIGKITVSSKLLTKTEKLTEEERKIIRDSMYAAADLLRDVHFDGPIAETLKQWQEKFDGTGPLGIKGEGILISARIIAVANAFIGMISPRSWRTAMSIEAATKFLLDQSDTHFDRRVVIALIHYVENHHGKAWLRQVLDGQKAA